MASNEKKRLRSKGRGQHSFLGIPHYIVRSPEFGGLSPWAVKLLIELAGKYNGKNNGDLSAVFTDLRDRGWRSPGTLSAAIKELVDADWFVRTRHGGKNRCSLYAITWWSIDECGGKLETKAEKFASNAWQKTKSVVGIRTNVVAIRTNGDQQEAA